MAQSARLNWKLVAVLILFNHSRAAADLTMATLRHHVKPPPPFDNEDKTIRFKLWKSIFTNYMTASNYATLDDGEKRAVLLANLHPRVYEIFETLPENETYEKALIALDKYFGDRYSKTFSVHNFRKLRQEPGQSIQQFVSNLKSMANECSFGATLNEEVKQQLISGVRQAKICQELLLIADTKTLEELIQKAKQMEWSISEQGVMSGSSTADSGSFGIKSGKRHGNGRNNTPQGSSSFVCRYCGENKKHSCKEECPAWGKTCNKCSKKNHFGAVCKSTSGNSIRANGKNKVAAMDGNNTTLDYLAACVGSKVPTKTVDSTTNGKKLVWFLDPGSPCTLVSVKCAQQLGLPTREYTHSKRKHFQVSSADELHSATGSQLNEVARIKCPVKVNGFSFTAELRVISNLSFDAIMGRDSLSNFSKVTMDTNGTGPELVLATDSSLPRVETIIRDHIDCFDKPLRNSCLKIDPEPIFDLTQDAVPIRCPTRRYNEADGKVINDTVKTLLENGIIRESTSAWRSQPVIVSKRGGGKRMAIDFSCKVNKFSKMDAFPVPLISDLVQKVSGYNYFSVIDITQAYHQVPLVPEDMEKTAFEANGKLYQYKRLCFGVTNAVPKFQRIMVRVFGDLPGVFIYLDDIAICGKTAEEHNVNLRSFFQRCRELNVSLNRKKCTFGTTKLTWLGYQVENNTLRPDPERLLPLKHYQEPKTMKELERFLGMATYYSKFVYNFAEQASTLQEIKNSGVFSWGTQASDCFDEIKKMISESFLALPDFSREMTLETDASGNAIAGILMQDGRPVSVASRRLSAAEKAWATVELEALAIVFCVEKFRYFLLGRHFNLHADQKAFSYLFSSSPKSTCKNNKLIRW